MENKTWTLTDLPPNRRPIDCKWVFKTKKDSQGNIQRYKARLVVNGFTQQKGIDYEETFSPVVRYNLIRVLLSLAAKYDLDIEQMDAVTAFLQGDLDEEIYMMQPKDFCVGNQVCKLNKSIYGLKQSSRQWNKKLNAALLSIGLQQSRVDPCVYFKIYDKNILIVAVYVDDLLIFSINQNDLKNMKSQLKNHFKMKELGEAHQCIGLNITRDREKGEIYLNQTNYINDVLK